MLIYPFWVRFICENLIALSPLFQLLFKNNNNAAIEEKPGGMMFSVNRTPSLIGALFSNS